MWYYCEMKYIMDHFHWCIFGNILSSQKLNLLHLQTAEDLTVRKVCFTVDAASICSTDKLEWTLASCEEINKLFLCVKPIKLPFLNALLNGVTTPGLGNCVYPTFMLDVHKRLLVSCTHGSVICSGQHLVY